MTTNGNEWARSHISKETLLERHVQRVRHERYAQALQISLAAYAVWKPSLANTSTPWRKHQKQDRVLERQKYQCKRPAMHARITMFTSKRVARASCIKSLEVASKKSKHENQYMRDNTPTAGWLARILLPRSVLMRRLSTKNKIRTLNASVRLTAQKVGKYAEKSGT
jgi:hypothetical protein